MNNCKALIFALALVLMPAVCWTQDTALIVNLQQDPDGIQGELVWTDEIQIGPNLILLATIEVTSKGNGFLSVGGVSLGRVYDDHNDGMTFESHLADIVFHDINSDGYKDVIVSGIVNVHHEKTDVKLERRAFVRIYLFDHEAHAFTNAYDSTPKGQK